MWNINDKESHRTSGFTGLSMKHNELKHQLELKTLLSQNFTLVCTH